MTRRNADESLRDLERQARDGDVDALERLLVESVRRDDKDLSLLVDKIVQDLGDRLLGEDRFREPGERGRDKPLPLSREARRLIEIGTRSLEHRSGTPRRRGERYPLKIAGKNMPMRKNSDEELRRLERVVKSDPTEENILRLLDHRTRAGMPPASRRERFCVFCEWVWYDTDHRLTFCPMCGLMAPSMKRRNSDEELRRLERLALIGDEAAYDRYVREARRRGLDDDQAELELLRRAGDPVAFLDSDIGEESRRLIKDKAKSEADAEANGKSAEGWSFGEDEDEWQIAWFGDAIAVNGELTRDGHGELAPRYKTEEEARAAERAPADFERAQGGGRVPGGSEQEIPVEGLTEWVMRDLKLDDKVDALREAVHNVIVKELGSTTLSGGEAFVYWTSDSGETELYRRVVREACVDCRTEGVVGRDVQEEPLARRPSETSAPVLCQSCSERRKQEVQCASCNVIGIPGEGDVSFYDDPRVAGHVLCGDCYSLEIGDPESDEDEPDDEG